MRSLSLLSVAFRITLIAKSERSPLYEKCEKPPTGAGFHLSTVQNPNSLDHVF